MSENAISNMLLMILAVMIGILMVLCIVYIILRFKANSKGKVSSEKEDKKTEDNKGSNYTNYTKKSIFDFFEFDKIEDNMIVRKNGKMFIMVVECQGVNYDLMSRIEKVGVEEGFQQFLNTLRHPIQIYIQTRSINLENSINTYNKKVSEIESKYNKMQKEYEQMKKSAEYTKEQLEAYKYELTKQRNLYDYAKDIVQNTEKMSLSRNVLTKRYYVVVPYYPEDMGNTNYDEDEIANMAFSELYTKCQTIIRALSACSVQGKILSSDELVDLLYVAYNRDESEVYGIDKAIRAGYEELYSTAPDVFAKKVNALDQEIKNRAIDLANENIEKAKSDIQKEAEQKQENMDNLIEKMAEMILERNERYVGKEVAQRAIEKIKGNEKKKIETKKETRKRKTEIKSEENEEKGGSDNSENKKSTRGRKKKSA